MGLKHFERIFRNEEANAVLFEQVYGILTELIPEVNTPARPLMKKDVETVFQVIDEVYLNNFFKQNYLNQFCFKTSNRMTASGANIRTSNMCEFTITVSNVILGKAYNQIENLPKTVNGLDCVDRLSALVRVVEHEIGHAIEFINYGKSGHGRRFKDLVNNTFGHTDVCHALKREGPVSTIEQNLSAGDEVKFNHNNQTYQGKITRITKRATIHIKNRKWYVPLDCLIKVVA